MCTLVRIVRAVDGAIMVCRLGGRVRVLDHAVCFECTFSGLLVVTLRHVNVLMHVVAHRAARCGT